MTFSSAHSVLQLIGSTPAVRITEAARPGSSLCFSPPDSNPHRRQGPWPLRMSANRGETSVPHVRHRHRVGLRTFSNSPIISAPASTNSRRAVSASTGAFPAQNRHAPLPRRTPFSRGDISFPQVRHRAFHGELTPGYGSDGSAPAARISAAAISGSMRAGIRIRLGSWRYTASVIRPQCSDSQHAF